MRSTKLVWGIGVIIFVALIGVIWHWQKPVNVAAAAVAKLGSAKTQKFAASLTVDNTAASQELLGGSAQVKLLLQGEFERQADARDSLAADIQLITATEGITLRIDAAARFIGDQAYLRVEKSPQAFPLLVQIKDKWLILPRGGDQTPGELPAEDRLFTTVERNGSDQVNGQNTNQYIAQATAATVLRMLDSIANILGTNLTNQQIDDIRLSIKDVTTVPVNLWVTPWSHELIKLSATLAIPNGNSILFELLPTDRNEEVSITVPANAITFEAAIATEQ